ncbi:hypothetical protein [Aeromonas sp. sif2416]|uniref:hypothetical protein n=1 Tax=Aeromonas sp. sif2416 TaxID=2854793 RepID=UPI001C47FAB1|nr:hypothetical protein [Aeromonas sp. sif2416]MBV7436959.1 hypothetical protein [Aeromonas sp. sif2416]
MPRSHYLLPLIAALLSGCGAEVVGTAVINGKLQAEQAEQAKVQAEQLKLQLDEAMRATQAAASAANAQ